MGIEGPLLPLVFDLELPQGNLCLNLLRGNLSSPLAGTDTRCLTFSLVIDKDSPSAIFPSHFDGPFEVPPFGKSWRASLPPARLLLSFLRRKICLRLFHKLFEFLCTGLQVLIDRLTKESGHRFPSL